MNVENLKVFWKRSVSPKSSDKGRGHSATKNKHFYLRIRAYYKESGKKSTINLKKILKPNIRKINKWIDKCTKNSYSNMQKSSHLKDIFCDFVLLS